MKLPEKFVNVQPLEAGQNARVFRATNSLVNRNVFLKIYPIPAGDPRSALREPHLLQQLNHDNLVKIYGADTVDDDQLLLEMQLVEGGTVKTVLDESIDSGEWPSTGYCLKLISEFASGLNHLHDNDYVHRDVKPANLLVARLGRGCRGIITDLGLASRVNIAGRAFATQHARIYRPPEVWQGRGYSVRSDIYQLGIVLFQMLGGGVDYTQSDLTDEELGRRAIEGTLFDLNSVGPHVGEPLRRLLRKCICAEADRLEAIPDFVAALSNVRANDPGWSYTIHDDGFELRREEGASTYEVAVESAGSRHVVTRRKKIGTGSFRRKGSGSVITHDYLGRSQQFRRLLIW